jgi:RNA polymerase sigma-70 factor, ECF subfamily
MSLEHANPERLMGWAPAEELDWDAVYLDQLPRIYNYFRFRFGSDVDVEELTAKTFEKAWRNRARYRRDIAGFSTWLFRIAHNVGIDYLRSRRPHVSIDQIDEPASESTPEHVVELQSDLARLAALTAGLPERERDLIALKYGATLSNREIATLTGLSESNVGTILHRTVAVLRDRW